MRAGARRQCRAGRLAEYLGPEEWDGPLPSFQASALSSTRSDMSPATRHAVSDATRVMMHPEDGLRAVVDAHQIAAGEWGAARASAACWRIVDRVFATATANKRGDGKDGLCSARG